MKKYEIIINIINNDIFFLSGHYIYTKVSFFIVLD